MVNKKISLCAIFLFIALSFNFYCQNAETSSKIDETQIVLTDNSSNSNSQNASNKYKAPSTAKIFFQMIFALIVTVALIYWVLRIVRKKTNIVKDEDDFLRRAAYLSVGNGKTVEVITLVDRAYVIGVTDEKITLIDEITDEKERDKDLIEAMNLNADKKQNTKKPVKFSDVLEMFTKKKNAPAVFSESEDQLDQLINKEEE